MAGQHLTEEQYKELKGIFIPDIKLKMNWTFKKYIN